MKNSEDVYHVLITKYLNNELDDSEFKKLQNWLKEEKNKALFKEYVVLNGVASVASRKIDTKVGLSKLWELDDNKDKEIKKISRHWKSYVKYAAVFVGVLLLARFYFNKEQPIANSPDIILSTGDIENEIVLSDERHQTINSRGEVIGVNTSNKLVYTPSNDAIITLNTLKVPYGKTITIVLPDSSKVHVNAGSVLKFPSHFKKDEARIVSLEGEAFFEITHNKKAPFVVNTKGINTEVFGTKFNVSSYDSDSFSEVVLVEGSVGVFREADRFKNDSDLLLLPQQLARIDADETNINVSNVDTKQYIAWVTGVMMFKNEPFKNIVSKLERFYNVTIIVDNKAILNEKFTGEFDQESIETVLKTIQNTTPFNYTINNTTISIND